MDNPGKAGVFPMVEPPHRTAKFAAKLFLCSVLSTAVLLAFVIFEIKSFPAGTDLSDVIAGAYISVGFFVLVDFLALYFYLSYVFYFASELVLSAEGIRRVRNGAVKEQFSWQEIAAICINPQHRPLESDWIMVMGKLPKKRSKRLFQLRGYYGIKWSKCILMQFSHTAEKEAAIRAFFENIQAIY